MDEHGSQPNDEPYGVNKGEIYPIVNETGRFKCPFPNCNKSFTRQEHLSRHKLNHWPKEIFRCSYVFPETGLSCNRTFVRKDLLLRHEKRHKKQGSRLSNPASVTPVAINDAHDAAVANASKLRRHSVEPVSTISQSLKDELKVSSDVPPFSQQLGVSQPLILPDAKPTNTISSKIPQAVNNKAPRMMENVGNQGTNQVFGWLFESGSQQQQQQQQQLQGQQLQAQPLQAQQIPSQSTMNKRNPVDASLPQAVVGFGSETTGNLVQGSLTPLFGNNSVELDPNYVRSEATSPMLNQNPSREESTQFVQAPISTDSMFSSTGGNQMHDLFSLDFLNNDPLDTFMQELSAPTMNSRESSTYEGTHTTESTTKAQAKCNDGHRGDIKDNLKVQKSNILELQKQNSGLNASDENKKKSLKNSPNFKKMVRSSMVPSFFHANPESKYEITEQKYEEIYDLVPELRSVDSAKLMQALKSFWLNFHPQYGLLHKPSFHVVEQPCILILALIMVGASFLGSEYRETICDPICAPLRWIIFSHEDFQPPSKTYIIQSLLLLECYEKASTNRYLHERSYLHHGTTIQLLRRTPSLGGHPLRLKTEEEPDILQDPQEVYRRWIDCEMLKRVAFYAFYMDSTHAAVYGYINLFINCNQIQLTMPCSDHVWESYDLSYQKLLDHGFGKGRVTFLSTLKQLLNEVVQTLQCGAVNSEFNAADVSLKSWNVPSILGRKVLLAGIISIIFQCQESNGDLMTTIARGCLCKDERSDISWQDITSFTLNYWRFIVQKSCNDPKDCFIQPVYCSDDTELNSFNWRQDNMDLSNMLGLDTSSSCKIPEYYMTQIILRIFHHDYYIFSGAPWRMNVKTGDEEYTHASKRILQVACEPTVGGAALIYAFHFLFEMFIDPHTLKVDTMRYNLNTDYIITRPNTIALTTLLIWSCSFALYGPEIRLWKNPATNLGDTNYVQDEAILMEQNELLKETYLPKESFEDYLLRMYHLLKINPSLDVISFQNAVLAKANLLENIEGRNNLCGIMKHMRNMFAQSYWDLGREFSRLFDTCLERSMGKSSSTCENMYKV